MFDIKTRLIRAGRDTNVYHWAGKDGMFTTALLGALTSVLGTAMHSASGGAGNNEVTLQVSVMQDAAQWIEAPITLSSLTDDDERAVMNALSAAVRPFRDQATRVKG